MSFRDNNDGWTMVRYGKRRTQPHPRPRQDTRFFTRQPQDTRFSTPTGQTQNKHNRTYAEVTATPHQSNFNKYNQQTTKRYTQERNDPPNQKQQTQQRDPRQTDRPQNNDPEFGENVRIMHKAITMIHHLSNISPSDTATEPPTITRLVDYLTNIIKPAAPSPLTRQLLNGNARNWAHTTTLILHQHYTDVLDAELDKLVTRKQGDWHKPLEIAIKWARRNRGRRLKQETLDKAERLIASYFGALDDGTFYDSSSHNAGDPGQTERVMPQTETIDVMATQTHTSQTRDDCIPIAPSGWSSTPQIHMQDLITLDEEGMVDTSFGTVQSLSLSQKSTPLPPRPPRTHTTLHPLPEVSPISTNEDTEKNSGDEEHPLHSTAAILNPVAALPSPANKTHTTPQQSLITQYHTQITHTTPQQSLITQDQTQIGSPNSFRVTRHPNTIKKLQTWDLSIWKKTLIIGDSNLDKIGTFYYEDLQIDSYPGANFLHAETLLRKSTAHCQVEKIILSFGINSRSARIKETVIKQMQKALKAAKDRFPQAHIWIPRINFSSSLPHTEQANIDSMNRHISRNFTSIPLLPNTLFKTENDGIHWTTETATNILKHWARHLN